MYTLRLYALTFVVFAIGGCASLFEPPAPDVNPTEVSGTYEIERFEFEPRASALQSIDMLDHVQRRSATLELTESRDFILSYRLGGGEEEKLIGAYELTPDEVTLKGQEKDAERYDEILLERTMTLQRRGPDRLALTEQKEVSPANLSSEYEGMTEVEGTLTVEFALEDESPFGGR